MSFSMGRLPSHVRAMLREMPDEHSMRLGHEASMAEMTSFWSSLDADQTEFLAKMLRRIIDSDDASARAGMYFGNAEMMLHMHHKRCVCGEKHRDPDDLLQELILRGSEREAEDQACELYNLKRVHTHDLMGQSTVAFCCLDCGQAWESIDKRRAAGEPGKCPGCMDDNTE